MSTPDNKISSNRRRLFKALSTAPVVMTLRPGAALANASSIQCAGNPMAPATVKFYKSVASAVCSSATGEGCHAFEERPVWDPGITGQTGDCSFWNDKFVVETSDNVYYVIRNQNSFGSGESLGQLTFSATAAANVAVRSGDQIAFYGANDETPCAVVTSPQMGLFLAIGGAVRQDGVPVGWESDGVWPEFTDHEGNVLGGSCLTSFPSSTGFTLADG